MPCNSRRRQRQKQSKFTRHISLDSVYKRKRAFILVTHELKKGTKIEHKEHPEFTKAQAEMIARDHLREDINYYKKVK